MILIVPSDKWVPSSAQPSLWQPITPLIFMQISPTTFGWRLTRVEWSPFAVTGRRGPIPLHIDRKETQNNPELQSHSHQKPDRSAVWLLFLRTALRFSKTQIAFAVLLAQLQGNFWVLGVKQTFLDLEGSTSGFWKSFLESNWNVGFYWRNHSEGTVSVIRGKPESSDRWWSVTAPWGISLS